MFERKPDAEECVHDTRTRLRDGSYRDPSEGKTLFRVLASEWLDGRTVLKRSSAARYRHTLARYVLPRWGDLPVRAVRREDIAAWSVELARSGGKDGKPLGPSSVRGARIVLGMVLAWAVETGRLAVNPAAGLEMPRVAPTDHVYLTHAQVDALADAAGTHRALILTAAYTGMRWSELSAVRAGRVDLDARRIHVTSAFTEVNGALHEDLPKSWARRKVPLPGFMVDVLKPVVENLGGDALVFTAPGGGPLRMHNFRPRVFDPAAAAAGLGDLGVHPHALRHTAASLAIAAGADVVTLQAMLGHKSATVTLDTYGHLMPDRLDHVADRLAQARSRELHGVPARTDVS